jgi:predicted membrane protein
MIQMKKLVVGVLIVLIGTFLLMVNVGIIPAEIKSYVFSWQSLLIAIGTICLFDRNSKNKDAGVILVLVGSIFLLSRIFNEIINLSGIIIPLGIIFLGIFFLIKSQRKQKETVIFGNHLGKNGINRENFESMPFSEMKTDHSGYIKREYVFTGSKERLSVGEICRVEVEAVFSGVEIDFTQVELSPDVRNVHIKISSVFSGVVIYIPSEWNVSIQKTGVFGGFTDKRLFLLNPDPAGKLVILELEAVFGGGEIRCYE